jgi:hypothetical protein
MSEILALVSFAVLMVLLVSRVVREQRLTPTSAARVRGRQPNPDLEHSATGTPRAKIRFRHW